jgi:hypothetical protein
LGPRKSNSQNSLWLTLLRAPEPATCCLLAAVQPDPADLARDGLGRLGEPDATHPLVCSEVLADISQARIDSPGCGVGEPAPWGRQSCIGGHPHPTLAIASPPGPRSNPVPASIGRRTVKAMSWRACATTAETGRARVQGWRYHLGPQQNVRTRDHRRSAACSSCSAGTDASVKRCPVPGWPKTRQMRPLSSPAGPRHRSLLDRGRDGGLNRSCSGSVQAHPPARRRLRSCSGQGPGCRQTLATGAVPRDEGIQSCT